jgi:hypothetical protein
VATATEDSKDGIAAEVLEGTSCEATVCFHVSDLGLDGASPSEEGVQGRGEPSS